MLKLTDRNWVTLAFYKVERKSDDHAVVPTKEGLMESSPVENHIWGSR